MRPSSDQSARTWSRHSSAARPFGARALPFGASASAAVRRTTRLTASRMPKGIQTLYPRRRLENVQDRLSGRERLRAKVVRVGRQLALDRLHVAAAQVAETARGEQRDRHQREHDERERDRGDAARVDVGRGLAARRLVRVAGAPAAARAVVGAGIGAARRELAVDGGLERAADDLLRVRVVAEVARDRVDRVLVAVEVVEPVDPAVVTRPASASTRRCESGVFGVTGLPEAFGR